MPTYQIAVLVGSLRRQSYNAYVANALATLAPPDLALTRVSIGDLPLYNQDDDASPSPAVVAFKSQLAAADAVIFVTPEYNRSGPAPLNNPIDHGSRPGGQSPWPGKPAGLLGKFTAEKV
jgi:chromate reductase